MRWIDSSHDTLILASFSLGENKYENDVAF